MNQPIKQLIQKFVANNCTPQEVDVLVDYFKNTEIDRGFPEMEEVFAVLDEFPELDKNDANRIYEQILLKAKAKENTISLKSERTNIFRKYTVWAAVFVGLLGALIYFGSMKYNLPPPPPSIVSEEAILLESADGYVQVLSINGHLQLTDGKGEIVGVQKGNQLVYRKGAKTSEEIEYNTLRIPYGKRFEIELGDGSRVFMNSGSSLKYPLNFPSKGNREVFLSGEAFFKVSKDKKRPFVVEAENMEIGVLGTEFNVSAYPEDASTSVVLVEGSIKLATKESMAETAILIPGQRADFQRFDKTLAISEVDTNLYTAWMQNGLVFRNMSFKYILKRMERFYNVTIINNDTDLDDKKFNASFGAEPLDKILGYFKQTYGMNFIKKDKDTIIINPKVEK